MAPVWQNEGTNEGTAAIITKYEEIQGGQNPEDPMWSERLVLWHGDVKTILRFRSVQAMRSISGERPSSELYPILLVKSELVESGCIGPG
ncbi:hypothetical protein N7G274_006542 [Stereocaulon virgatum]|uniref:DUF6589 domain-containing protein n=1 Tax=Stereocaulon virgatum TaxID=373712 RepID=A0ABR4A674_9LECA